MNTKSPDAFRTISEVSEVLDTPAHVLRFWESRFSQVRPVKRAGGRRYYRPGDIALLAGIKKLLHDDGMTIRGVQKILREKGVRHVAGIATDDGDDSEAPMVLDARPEDVNSKAEVIALSERSAAQKPADRDEPDAVDDAEEVALAADEADQPDEPHELTYEADDHTPWPEAPSPEVPQPESDNGHFAADPEDTPPTETGSDAGADADDDDAETAITDADRRAAAMAAARAAAPGLEADTFDAPEEDAGPCLAARVRALSGPLGDTRAAILRAHCDRLADLRDRMASAARHPGR